MKTMRKIFLLTATLFISSILKSQSISISTGIAPDANNAGNTFWFMIGLFDGTIGDSIIIKKGRFDYYVEVEGL